MEIARVDAGVYFCRDARGSIGDGEVGWRCFSGGAVNGTVILRDAAIDQFSKSRPGYLVAQLHDLTAEQLLDIAESDSSWRGNASRLQVMTSDLLDNSSRSHVHTIVYLSHSTLDNSAKGGEAIIADGTAYTFANANHPNYKDSRFGVFRDINRLDSPRIIQMAS